MKDLIVKKFSELDKQTLDFISQTHYNYWVKFNPKLNKEDTIFKFRNKYIKNDLPFGIALFNEDLVGFCTLKIRNLEKYPEIYPWISNLLILEKHRNQGYGKKLIKIGEDILKQKGYSKVYVWTDQAPEFYKKLGFKFVQEVEKNEGGKGQLFVKNIE